MTKIATIIAAAVTLVGCDGDAKRGQPEPGHTQIPAVVDRVWWETHRDPETGTVLRCLWGWEAEYRKAGLAVWCIEADA